MLLDFTSLNSSRMAYLQKRLVMILGLKDVKNNDVIIWITSYFLSAFLKMLSQVELFPYPDKQKTPEEDRWMQQPKCCVMINNNEDEVNSPKINSRDITLQTSSKKFK